MGVAYECIVAAIRFVWGGHFAAGDLLRRSRITVPSPPVIRSRGLNNAASIGFGAHNNGGSDPQIHPPRQSGHVLQYRHRVSSRGVRLTMATRYSCSVIATNAIGAKRAPSGSLSDDTAFSPVTLSIGSVSRKLRWRGGQAR